MSKQYHGLVLYVRFVQKNKHLKEQLEAISKDNCISTNQLVMSIFEQFLKNEKDTGTLV